MVGLRTLAASAEHTGITFPQAADPPMCSSEGAKPHPPRWAGACHSTQNPTAHSNRVSSSAPAGGSIAGGNTPH